MTHVAERLASLVAMVSLAAVLACGIAPSRADAAEELPVGAADNVSVAQLGALLGKLAELESRVIIADSLVRGLTSRVAFLEEQVGRIDSEKSTIKAPFIVSDGQGRQIFSVSTEQSGEARIILGDPASSRVSLAASGAFSQLTFVDSGGQSRASLYVSPKQSELSLADDTMALNLGTRDSGAVGLAIGRDGATKVEVKADELGGGLDAYGAKGTVIAALSSGDAPLTLFDDQGKPFFTIGAAEGAGKPRLTVGDASGARFQAGVNASGDGAYMAVFDSADNDRGGISAGASDTTIDLSDPQGTQLFQAGITKEIGKPRLTVGDASGARMQAGVTTGGDGAYMTLFDSADNDRGGISVTTSDTTIDLSDPQGAQLFQVGITKETGKPRLTVGDPSGARLQTGVASAGDGAYLSFYDEAARERAAITAVGSVSAFEMWEREGGQFFNLEEKAPETGRPRLTVGKPSGVRLQAGVTQADDGSYLALIDAGDEERASITAAAGQTVLTVSDNRMRIDLGTPDPEKQPGLFLAKGDTDAVIIRLDEAGGGTMRIVGRQGKPVIGFYADEDGGNLVVTGAAGGTAVANLHGGAAGGQLTLFDNAGVSRVYARATDTGYLELVGGAGLLTMDAGPESPRLKMAVDGTVMVQAGVSVKGYGLVQTGPNGNGAAGTLGSGFQAASQIQGKSD